MTSKETAIFAIMLMLTLAFGAFSYYQGYSEGINDGYYACMMSHGK